MIEPMEWLLIGIGAFFIGMGKAGLKGVDMLSVILMAMMFGSKSSTGIVLPLLSMADIGAVIYYNRHAQWSHFWKLIPWMAVGILLGVYVGKDMDEELFRRIMIATILVTVAIVVRMEFFHKSTGVPSNKGFAVGTGLIAGFTTMIGNLAGAFANLYFLAMRLPKNDFIGTTAWIFLVINLFKLPFQVFYWKNITVETLSVDLVLIPVLAMGFFTGIKVVGKINELQFRKMILWLTVIGSLLMFFKK